MSSPYNPASDGIDRDLDRAVTGAHADYHREIQQHAEPDGLVDDVVTYRMLAPHLMRTLLFLVAPTVLLLLKFVIDYLASMSSPDAFTDVVSTLLGLVVVVLYLAGIASFFAPAKEPIAEHARLLENRGDVAASAFDHVRLAAAARQSPAEVTPSTVAGVPVLVFRQYSERAMLLVQPYGRDLYVGWTMWRSRSTATLLLHFLRDTFGRFAPSPRFSAELRAAATRALRESVHSLSREGVAAAVHAQRPAGTPVPDGGPVPGADARYAPRPDTTSPPAAGATSGGRPHAAHPAAPHAEPPAWWDLESDEQPGREPEREPSRDALPGTGMPAGRQTTWQQTAWTGGADGLRDRAGAGGERVGVRRETRDDDRDDPGDRGSRAPRGREAGDVDGWGPPPPDRW